MAQGLLIRPYDRTTDVGWAEDLLEAEFAGRMQARRGELVDPLEGEGLVADMDGRHAGLLTWLADRPPAAAEVRLMVVAADARGRGIGEALLDGALRMLAAAGCRRIWLVTTNDALDALRFYQRHGFRLTALRPGAVDEARGSLKPSIGTTGRDGIPIRDELELELDLEGDREPSEEHSEEPAEEPTLSAQTGQATDQASVPGHLG